MRHLISNIVGWLIPDKALRDKVRTMIRYPQTRKYIKYVRQYAKNMSKCKIKTRVGYGCSNFIVILNDKWVFKFPLLDNGVASSVREKRIVDAFQHISPIKIPQIELLKFDNMIVRKYEFAKGKLLTEVDPNIIAKNREHIAKQIANFLYVVGKSDPKEIRDLKADPAAKPDFLYGWFQGDVWQNFMLDPKTMNINFFIDWEDAGFKDFKKALRAASHHWDKFGYRGIIVDSMAEYAKLYYQQSDEKKK